MQKDSLAVAGVYGDGVVEKAVGEPVFRRLVGRKTRTLLLDALFAAEGDTPPEVLGDASRSR